MNTVPLHHRNRRVGLIAAAIGLAMLGLGYAAVARWVVPLKPVAWQKMR
jgi:hypothetical protein